tara:strand:- start:8305 stop:8778 length:474 start_codon:yes stop_codon:yes gene_type:complete
MLIKKFDDFEPFNQLRKKMGAEKLGCFELFDPQRQITYSERESLELGNFKIESARLKILKDKTIAFKNTRLWLSWLNEEVFHLAACEHIQKRRHLKGTFIAGLNPLSEKTVCLECLQLLKFDGLDARRSRRLDLAETIQKDFKLADFQKEYPFYPLV